MLPPPASEPRVPFQLRLAGWLLVGTTVLGLLTAMSLMLMDPEGDSLSILQNVAGEGALAGRVTNATGEPLAAVNLSIAGTELSTTSDGNGEFNFPAIPVGEQNLTARKPGYITQYYNTFIVPGERGNRVTLELANGEGIQVVVDQNQSRALGQSLTLCATLIVMMTLFAGIGAWKALQGRDFTWVVGGAILGLFTFGFLLGSLMALAALILALRYRRLFTDPQDLVAGDQDDDTASGL